MCALISCCCKVQLTSALHASPKSHAARAQATVLTRWDRSTAFSGEPRAKFSLCNRTPGARKAIALDYKTSYNTGMLKLKVRAVGGSLGIILPKEALAKMKLTENDEVFLTEAPGGGYRLTPYSPEFERQMTIVEDIAKRRRNVLRELAK
jgi:putative addiction module antidote